MSAERSIDWLLILRYALLISLCALIPVPLLDTSIENFLRRRLVRTLADRHGVQLDAEAIATLGNAPTGGCMGCVWSVLVWPFKKVLRTVLIVFAAKGIADTSSEIIHRALMLEEALELGYLPRDPDRVRLAMDKALVSVDTRVIERRLLGVFQDHTNDLNRVIFRAAGLARQQDQALRNQALADAVEADTLGSGAREMTSAMLAAVRGTGVVPELLQWFRAELGEVGPPAQVGGVVQPELLPEDAPAGVKALAEPDVEEAEEVLPGDRDMEHEE